MSRRKESLRNFGGPTFGDWVLLGLSGAGTAWCGNRIYRKHKQANQRRRTWEEQWDEADLVEDYDVGYYLR